jgi:hypothetical protein
LEVNRYKIVLIKKGQGFRTMQDKEAVDRLRQCKPIVQRLVNQGINALLSESERAALQAFNEILMQYQMKEFRLLAERAGLEGHELGTLKVRAHIEYERRRGLVECPRCGRDKYQEKPHHYLCHTAEGEMLFPEVPSQLMREIIRRVDAEEAGPEPAEEKEKLAEVLVAPALAGAGAGSSKGLLLKKLPTALQGR